MEDKWILEYDAEGRLVRALDVERQIETIYEYDAPSISPPPEPTETLGEDTRS